MLQILVQTPLSDEQLTVYQAQSWQTHLASGAKFAQKSTISAGGQFKPQLEGKSNGASIIYFFFAQWVVFLYRYFLDLYFKTGCVSPPFVTTHKLIYREFSSLIQSCF